jgi:hypothetical protein
MIQLLGGVFYKKVIEFGIPVEMVRLINMSQSYPLQNSVVEILFDSFVIKDALKQRDISTPLLFIFALDTPLRGFS